MDIKRELKQHLEKETAKRVARMKKEFGGKLEVKVFENTEGYDQVIAQVGIPVTALCEHHLVAFFGTVSIAYVPGNWLIGLSKLARIAEKHLNPTVKTIQEKATHRIMKDLVAALDPVGAMVVVKAEHNCIAFRGVKKPSTTITSAVYGVFAEKENLVRQEFLALIPKE